MLAMIIFFKHRFLSDVKNDLIVSHLNGKQCFKSKAIVMDSFLKAAK